MALPCVPDYPQLTVSSTDTLAELEVVRIEKTTEGGPLLKTGMSKCNGEVL
jgi:hypothetical protein